MSEAFHENLALAILAAAPLAFAALLAFAFGGRRLHERPHSRRLVVWVADGLGIGLAISLLALGGELPDRNKLPAILAFLTYWY